MDSNKDSVVYISKYVTFSTFGMESRQIYLSREFVKRGYDVSVFASNANHQLRRQPTLEVDVFDGIKVNWVYSKLYKNAYGIGRVWSWISFELNLRRKLKKANFSDVSVIIVSSLSLLSIINGLYLKRKYNAKLFLEIRDIWPLILTELTAVSKFHPLYIVLNTIEKLGYRRADLIIGTMPNLIEHVLSSVKTKAPVIQIPHLINNSLIHSPKNIYSSDLTKIRSNGFKTILAYCGNISTSAGLHFLLECASELATLNVAIVILGEGPLKSKYLRCYTQDNIYFLDKICQSSVVAFLKECDLLYDGYLQSDIYKYGSSRNKYVEYCLASKPIIVSYEGYPLFVEKYSCGLVVKPESSLSIITGVKRILKYSETERALIGQRAFSYAKENLQIPYYVDKLETYL